MIRYSGHMDGDINDVLYSFTHADQEHNLVFGLDTSTEEGRVAFKKEWDALVEMTPELLGNVDFKYPHEMEKPVC